MGKWQPNLGLVNFLGIAFAIRTNQPHLPKNGCQGLIGIKDSFKEMKLELQFGKFRREKTGQFL